jgi:3-phenylpropionate/trans-cinnamate dioxygenase ferredoxin reductase subunit
MNQAKVVVLGGGMVAGYAAKQMVELGLSAGELAILSADNAIPYERPPLSKGFLAGKETEDAIKINPEDFYRQHRIELQLDCEVTALDTKRKRLVLKRGDEFGFQKLIIATGARPRTLNIAGSKLKNLFYLRTLNNSKSIRSAAEKAKHAVVVGGGFIGMEVAAVLAQKGIEVTMVLSDDRIWKRVFTPEMSAFFEGYYAAKGVRIVKSSSVKELQGDATVRSAVLSDGQTIRCDMVVAGIGVEPLIEIASSGGLEVSNGIVVNEYLQTNDSNIFAAGDVANYQDALFGKRRRVEHWDNAVSQGQHCARSVMGDVTPFKHVPYFFSDVFDLSYEYWGDSSSTDEIVHRGDITSNSFSVWWLRENRVRAAFVMNRPEEERNSAPKWIEVGQSVSAAKLVDASQPVMSASAPAAA